MMQVRGGQFFRGKNSGKGGPTSYGAFTISLICYAMINVVMGSEHVSISTFSGIHA